MPLRLQVLAHNAYPDWPTKHGLSSFSEILSVNKFAYACCPRNETTAHLNFSSLVLKLSFARLTEQLNFRLMHRPDSFPVLLFLLLVVPLRTFAASPIQERADRFLKLANAGYQALYRVNSEAQWLAVTDVTPEHDAAAEATGKA